MKTLVLYKTMFKQTIIGLRRYMFETITGTVTLFLFFLALFYGAKAFGADGPQFGNTLDHMVVGYAVWTMAIFVYFSMAQDLLMEAQLGTLEQLAMSPLGLGRVLMGRALSGLVWQLLTMAVLLTAMMAATGKWLNVDLLSIIPILILTVAGVTGLSFALAGLAIVFKKVQSALQIVQVGFILLLAVPLSRVPALKFAPLSWGFGLLKKIMVDGETLLSLGAGDVGFLALHAVVYIALGLAVFRMFENVARSRGLLGHY